MNNTPSKFLLSSDPPIIDFSNSPKEVFKRVLITDSIFDFYPDAEITINDEGGAISDYIISSEGLKFTSKLGSDDDGYLESTWVWGENQLQDTVKSYHVGGDFFLGLDHYNSLLDVEKSNAYNDTVSNAVKDIIKNDFNITETKDYLITDTSEIGYRYRFNEFVDDKFEKWADNAYSQSFDKSPFVSFFNSAGKFYFCALEDLFKREDFISDEPFILDMSPESQENYNAIDDYNAFFVGLPFNKNNYRKKIYNHSKASLSENETFNIEDFKLPGSGNYFINKDTLKLFEKAPRLQSSNKYLGIFDKSKEQHLYNGLRNNEFFDSYLPMRLEIIIKFNKDAVSGKKIKTELGTTIAQKNDRSSEYSGEWLIIESSHFFDADAIPYSKLLIAKSGAKVDPVHPFKKPKDSLA